MADSRLRIVVTGLVAQYPLGGVTWDYIQYPVGLARMGHDVYYLEDSGQWPYDPVAGGLAKQPDFNVRYLADVMERFGLGENWAYRFMCAREFVEPDLGRKWDRSKEGAHVPLVDWERD